ncbi:MAG: terminase family protein [Oscillospiraceae bacterium]|nr:terminase family protein [Oscillospiraceae bacterium]
MITLSPKQREVCRRALHSPKRWNIKVGAVRSGKTFCDLFLIPRRIALADPGGQIALIGYTSDTLERNILSPMRSLYGERFVGRIGKGGRARLFGRECLCIGAYTASCGDKLRGISLSYAYGDEMTTWNEEVFTMLKSRLDREGSVFDGSCNPDVPFHWFKRLMDSASEEGISVTEFIIDDNRLLPADFVRSLKEEYAGTVYYDRYILGKWCAGEGAVYRRLAESPESFVTDDDSGIICADMGVDFGGSASATAFVLTGCTKGYERVTTVDSFYSKEPLSPERLEREFCAFVRNALVRFPLRDIYCDSAEQILIRGLENAARRERLPVMIHNARKSPINDRISFFLSLMGQKRFFIHRRCPQVLKAFREAVWKDGKRLDDGSSDIDSLDAAEYSVERRMRDILER